ncbi:MAG: hypothetical protein IT365_05210 [Candidatus Hydrogenedentes bacterium]|nr:hypothetical protein [Candidatus Hydrogenedentota bacterium]
MDEKLEKRDLLAAFLAAEKHMLIRDICDGIGWDQSAYSKFKRHGHASPERRAQAIGWLEMKGFWPVPPASSGEGLFLREAVHGYQTHPSQPNAPREIAYRLSTDDIMTTILRARELGDEKCLSRLFDLVSHIRLIETNCQALIEELGSIEASHRVLQTEIANELQRRRKSDPENIPKSVGRRRAEEPEL